jgi:hypothetical protein
VVFEVVVVAAHRAEVGLGGGAVVGVVDGVVELGAVGRAGAAGTHAGPVADRDPTGEGGAGEPAGRVVTGDGSPGVVPGAVAGHDVAAHPGPARGQLAGEFLEAGELAVGDPQFDDVVAASGAGAGAGAGVGVGVGVGVVCGAAAGEVDEQQVSGVVDHDHPP